MVDCRTMLSALVAAYDQHRKWMMADKFAALQRAVEHARDVLAQPEPAPAADGEVGDLVLAMKELAYDVAPYTCDLLNRAADLLERQAAAAPVARLPEDAQVIEPANRTILVPVPAPIPVSERLPGPDDCAGAGDCWWYSSFMSAWIIGDVEYGKRHRFRYWLPAHALPLPEVE